MTLDGLAADVDLDQVHALLLARSPSILDPESPDHVVYEGAVKGITAEVVAVTGADPADGPYRDLVLRAIELGTAAQLEEALYPEQQLGDGSRAAMLQARFDRLLARLGASGAAAGDLPSTPRPVGSFPPPRCYPDPVEPYRPDYLT